MKINRASITNYFILMFSISLFLKLSSTFDLKKESNLWFIQYLYSKIVLQSLLFGLFSGIGLFKFLFVGRGDTFSWLFSLPLAVLAEIERDLSSFSSLSLIIFSSTKLFNYPHECNLCLLETTFCVLMLLGFKFRSIDLFVLLAELRSCSFLAERRGELVLLADNPGSDISLLSSILEASEVLRDLLRAEDRGGSSNRLLPSYFSSNFEIPFRVDYTLNKEIAFTWIDRLQDRLDVLWSEFGSVILSHWLSRISVSANFV